MKILVTGATGFIGKKLVTQLFRDNHQLVVLTRNSRSAAGSLQVPCEIYEWDSSRDSSSTQKVLIQALTGVDAIIHLAGEPIAARRWTEVQKNKIRDSRVLTSARLMDALLAMPGPKPQVMISSSAIGYYGDRGDEILTENSKAGEGFLADVCKSWEEQTLQRNIPGMRQVACRVGIVLGKEGGALQQLVPIFQLGVGGAIGNGQQWMSWIHLDDLVSLYCFLLENKNIEGPVNAVAPNPVTNSDFSHLLGTVLRKPSKVPVPTAALKLSLGQMSEMVLGSQRVIPEKILQTEFQFQYPLLISALGDICSHSHDQEFSSVQYISKTPEDVFSFFSQAENLEAITPPWLKFHVVRKSKSEMGEETVIDYKLKIHGVPVRWQSRIENWIPNECFSDIQIRGPYSKWHHTHSFEKIREGTLMSDRILYRVPGGVLGNLILGRMVRRDIESIFQYRRKKIEEKFSHDKQS